MTPRGRLLVAAGLAAVTVLAFLPSLGNGFVNYDDPLYVTKNFQVQQGLTLDGVRWAFTAIHGSNWHPLTWLSHMLDVSLFGMDPMGPHLVNVLLHALNAALLFLVLARATGLPWPSLAAAALFAVHPLRVESVSWIAERKDVLCLTFGFSALWMYLRYTESRRWAWYAGAIAAFALGLLVKPMIVTLPAVMLLMDAWPLGRIPSESFARSAAKRVTEKIPFLALVAASGAITVIAQRQGGLKDMEAFPMAARLANAAIACVAYLGKTIWPVDLAVHYPHPGAAVSYGLATIAFVLLAAITIACTLLRRQRPYLLFGWAWYLVALLPVIGIIQVGNQSMADRYTYLPHAGLFVAVVWGMRDLVRHRGVAVTLTMAALAVCATVTVQQQRHWKDSLALYTRLLDVQPDSLLAHANLSEIYLTSGDDRLAVHHIDEALRLNPRDTAARINQGILLGRRNDLDSAIALFQAVLLDAPNSEGAHFNLGMALFMKGDYAAAAPPLAYTAKRQPADADVHLMLGVCYGNTGRLPEARAEFETVLRLRPGDPGAKANLARIEP